MNDQEANKFLKANCPDVGALHDEIHRLSVELAMERHRCQTDFRMLMAERNCLRDALKSCRFALQEASWDERLQQGGQDDYVLRFVRTALDKAKSALGPEDEQ